MSASSPCVSPREPNYPQSRMARGFLASLHGRNVRRHHGRLAAGAAEGLAGDRSMRVLPGRTRVQRIAVAAPHCQAHGRRTSQAAARRWDPATIRAGRAFHGRSPGAGFACMYPGEVAGLALIDSSHPEQQERLPKTELRPCAPRAKSGRINSEPRSTRGRCQRPRRTRRCFLAAAGLQNAEIKCGNTIAWAAAAV